MTTKAALREQNRIRVTRHRARDDRGMGKFYVEIHKARLIKVLKGWGMPESQTWRRDKLEVAVAELVELVITDPVIVDRIHELQQR
jgi:hypothetical protein